MRQSSWLSGVCVAFVIACMACSVDSTGTAGPDALGGTAEFPGDDEPTDAGVVADARVADARDAAGRADAADAVGAAGSRGAAGTTGAAGSRGAAGMTGAAGSRGAAGTTGAAGSRGAAGTTGAAGTRGTAATAGGTGVAGTTGAAGTTGVAGTTGEAGTTGAAGSGAAGITGAAGTRGDGGTPDDGGGDDDHDVCDRLEKDYVAAIDDAIKCDLDKHRRTCAELVDSSLACPLCKIWVDDKSELNEIRADWKRERCDKRKPLCSLTRCLSAGPGICLAPRTGGHGQDHDGEDDHGEGTCGGRIPSQ
jgi:hypothetical protein